MSPALYAQTGTLGELNYPDPGQVQSGEVLVRGWVLDPEPISKISLYVDDQFQFNTNMNQPRIDIVEAYPNWPGIHTTAPGFSIGFSASRFSNGPHTVSVRVFTSDNRVTEIGRRTIQIDNTINQRPFGTLDIPDASGIFNASGSFPVSGWATDTDGVASVDVMVDGGILQGAVYGDARPDVANAYPDLPTALYSAFVANIDTTRIQDGVHSLTVRVTDRLGLATEVGRRTIQVFNNDQNLRPFGSLDEPRRDAVLYGSRCGTVPIISPPFNPQAHLTPVRGWALDLGTRSRGVGRVSYVELLIDGVRWYSTDDCNYSTTLGGFTNCYGLPRYDVQRYYPTYPDSPRSGFMFTMDVGALLALGVRPGNHVLKVRVGDQEQTFATLPNEDGIPVFFTCADINQDLASIGSIDVPTSFDFMKGTVQLQGWAADENGGVTAVEIIIDGNYIGAAEYGFARPDVQQQFPQIFNSATSGWRFSLDTTKLSNARHRLTVRVLDNFGHRSEIGSTDFYTQNTNATP
jgi:hypothetical protein